jgi:hypothetical protein
MRRRLAAISASLMMTLVWPAAGFAADATSEAVDKPSGTDHTLTTIFVIALGLPLLLAILTLIDIAVGRGKNDQH